MHIQRLKLFHFRNLENCAVEFSSHVNLIIGPNGQGKTNLIEAVTTLAEARSFRTSRMEDLVRWGEREASVFGEIQTASGVSTLGLIIRDGKREAYINGERSKGLIDIIGKFSCITFSPADIDIVKGSPAERRRLVDRAAAETDPLFASASIQYSRAIKNKTAALRAPGVRAEEIEAWNDLLASHASYIANKRREVVLSLGARASRYYERFAPQEEELQTSMEDPWGETVTAENVRVLLSTELRREMAAGTCLLGPHRDDLSIQISKRDARAFASQGQARSLVLALKLAVLELLEARFEESPVVILDDVDAELDLARREAFFSMIFSSERQVFITATEVSGPMRMMGGEAKTLFVKEGQIDPVKPS